MHPVGPLPPATYWRRRALLLVPLVVLLLLLRSCAGGSGGPSRSSSVTTAPTPTPTASSSPAPPAPRPTAATTAPASAAPTQAAAASACADSALRLVVTTDASTYPVGAYPRFTLTVTNTGPTACTRDLGSKAVSLRVVSGPARTWDSDDCASGNGSSPTRLAPGAPWLVDTLTWSGKRSSPGCPTPREQATAGTYQVFGTVGTLTSPRVVFRFR